MNTDRDSRVIDLDAAVGMVEDGMTVGLSGFSYQNPPMAVVRAIVRAGVRDLTLVSGPTAGIETDLLVGAGCVTKVIAAGVAMERIAAIAPAFRFRAERGELEVWECDECIWYVALQAGAWGVPYLLWPGGVATSLPELNPGLVEVEEEGRPYLRVPAIRPDIVFIHAEEADRHGNVRESRRAYLGRSFAERALAAASNGPVIATVESLVSDEQTVAEPEWTMLTGAFVVEAPWGAHPGGVSGRYVPDLEHIEGYCDAARALATGDALPFQDYLSRFVTGPGDQLAYVAAAGGSALRQLELDAP